jgi:predicted nucleic acid-binding protein
MKTIAIQDANILIDLVKTGLFGHCLVLNYQFTTTDLILDELYEQQVTVIQPHIDSGKFIVTKVSADELIEIQIAAKEDTKLSDQDWSALYYAQQQNALLLTGDSRLRILAEAKGITVCGIFWVLDRLVDTTSLSKSQACNFLKDLLLKNKRLPMDEYEQRIENWCGK